jgi:hypothetical protein
MYVYRILYVKMKIADLLATFVLKKKSNAGRYDRPCQGGAK